MPIDMMYENADAFPQLGSVYKRASIKPVSEASTNVANLTLNSAKAGNSGVEEWRPRDPAPNVWKGWNLISKGGLQSDGNAWESQKDDNKNFPGLSSQQSYNPEQGPNLPASPVQSQIKDDAVLKPLNNDSSVILHDAADHDDSDFDDEIVFDSDDDDDVLEYDSDSNARELNLKMVRKSKWFRAFFTELDKLTEEDINRSKGEWHCPACSGGPGAIDWYRGVYPLMYHSKTKQTRRAKLHRVFAKALEEEMLRRGIVITPVSEVLGKWEGLNERAKDYIIVWPPMVFILNTRYEQEENGKWIGMGNQELLDYFSSYGALKARHAYGPQGHRGMSVLIFESSGAGYIEAARLHKHFKDQGRDKDAWNRNRVLFCPGGKRQLYGYLASKEDLDIFNQHFQGRFKLKFEMRSYQEAVERDIKQMSKDCQELTKFKNSFAREQNKSLALASSVRQLSEKLLKAEKESRFVREQTKLLYEQHKEEIDALEEFFKDQIKVVHQAIAAKEDKVQKLQQEKRDKFLQSNADLSAMNDTNRLEDIAQTLKLQHKEMEEFEAEREKLKKNHEDKRAASTKRYWEEQLELGKEFERALTQLLEKYNRDNSDAETSINHRCCMAEESK